MYWFLSLLQILFPSPYTKSKLKKIPTAPNPIQANIFSLYDYHKPPGKKLIYYLKKNRDRYLAYILAEKIHEYLLPEISDQLQFSYFIRPIIIPVPLHKKQYKMRGFNQSSDIARYLASMMNGVYRGNTLIKTKKTKKQALISQRHIRHKNILNCFNIHPLQRNSIQHKDIILVDDLVTTGATLKECEKVLRKHGTRNVIAITIAH